MYARSSPLITDRQAELPGGFGLRKTLGNCIFRSCRTGTSSFTYTEWVRITIRYLGSAARKTALDEGVCLLKVLGLRYAESWRGTRLATHATSEQVLCRECMFFFWAAASYSS